MQNNGTQNRQGYIIHLTYACSFLLAVLAIIGYLVWDKHQIAIQRQVAIEQKRSQENERKMKILGCRDQVGSAYTAFWTAACKKQANKVNTDLKNCINEAAAMDKYTLSSGKYYNLEIVHCKNNYVANPNPDCTLPASIASSINNDYEESKKLCDEMIL